MFPGPMFPGSYVPWVLCSPFFPKMVLCSPVAIHTGEHRTLFRKSGEHRTLFWEKGPMFPAIYQSLKIFKLFTRHSRDSQSAFNSVATE